MVVLFSDAENKVVVIKESKSRIQDSQSNRALTLHKVLSEQANDTECGDFKVDRKVEFQGKSNNSKQLITLQNILCFLSS